MTCTFVCCACWTESAPVVTNTDEQPYGSESLPSGWVEVEERSRTWVKWHHFCRLCVLDRTSGRRPLQCNEYPPYKPMKIGNKIGNTSFR